MTTLVPANHPADIDALRTRVEEREAALAERAADVDRLDDALTCFAALYRHHVGTLHEQLDQLELEIAEAELAILSNTAPNPPRRSDAAPASTSGSPSSTDDSPGPRLTSDAIRKLFRDVARAVHPDLAPDEEARQRRNALMVAANRAYALGDAEELRRILESWARSPDEVQGITESAIRLRLERRLAQIDELMEAYDRDQAVLEASPLYELKARIDEAAAAGRDMMADMVRRLRRDIMAATNRLEAMRFTP